MSRGQLVSPSQLPYFYPKQDLKGLLDAAIHFWADPREARSLIADLKSEFEKVGQAGRARLAAEYASLLASITRQSRWEEESRTRHAALGTRSILDAVPRPEPWQECWLHP